MNLTYRGIPYTHISPSLSIESEIVEGIYHGIQTEIPLPQPSDQDEMHQDLMTDRGVKL